MKHTYRLKKYSPVHIGLFIGGLLLLLTTNFFIIQNQKASAYAPPFSAGKIIDDAVFTNTTTMSASQIQDFLNSKVSSCDTNGTQQSEYGGGTRAQWGQANYGQSTFTCLKDYQQNGLSAAQIIYNVSQQYHINPEVLIVLLQKEEGLVTDTWPLGVQYDSATGYNCPDNGGCSADPQYGGLTNQLTWSAKMFHAIETDSPTWYTPYELGDNYILYNKDSSCGGSIVNIQNRATQALYNYTPYQPNQAALNAPMGTTVSCGAYGNINFFRYFQQWFGSPLTPPYQWSYVYQAAYTDDSLTQKIPSPLRLQTGQKVYLTVSALNTGTATWTRTGDNPIKLGTSQPQDRNSALCTGAWLDCARPALLAQNSVPPGQIGTFGFWMTVPDTVGYYKEFFNLVAENNTWLNDTGLYFDFNVIPTYRWIPLSADYYSDPDHTQPVTNGNLLANTRSYGVLKVKNTGNQTWQNDPDKPVRLGTSQPNDHISPLCANSWNGCDRLSTLQESTVSPGQIGTFNFELDSPVKPNFYGESLNIVIENQEWMIPANYVMWMKTNTPTYSWQLLDNTLYTDSSKTTQANLQNIQPGQRLYVNLNVKNTGNTTWSNTNNPVRVGTYSPFDHSSIFYDSTWVNGVRTANITQPTVQPGQTGTFSFWITAPTHSGQFSDTFNLVSENKQWMDNSAPISYSLKVN